jgi:hypothetical protein
MNEMKITIPKEFLTDDMEAYLLWHRCERIAENERSVTFQTHPHSIGIVFEVFGISSYERKRAFYDNLTVCGGKKSFSRDWIIINPLLNKQVGLRLSEEMYQFVKEITKRRKCSMASYLRNFIYEPLVRGEPRSEKERRGQEIARKILKFGIEELKYE